MRKMNTLEKSILANMIKYPPLKEEGLFLNAKFLEDNYINRKNEVSLMIKSSERKALISTPKERKSYTKDCQKHIVFIITYFNLIKDLINEGKILVIGEEVKEDNTVLGGVIKH